MGRANLTINPFLMQIMEWMTDVATISAMYVEFFFI